MTTEAVTAFQDDYLATWTEPSAERRRALVPSVWAPEGRLFVSPDTTLTGVEEIGAHIDRVHDDLIAGKRLTFTYDQALTAGEALLLRWSMRAPTGDVVGRGVDVVHRDAEGRAETVYMFTGVS